MATLDIAGLTVRAGAATALAGVDLRVSGGELVGLVGPGGAGKSTLFDCVTRQVNPVAGRLRYAGRDLLAVPPYGVPALGIARTDQELGLFPGLTVRQNVMIGGHRPGRPGFRAAASRFRGDRHEERRLRRESDDLLARLGLLRLADRLAGGVSPAVRARAELARALAARPRLLLLDAPVAGLTGRELAEFAGVVRAVRAEQDISVVVAARHLGFVAGLCDRLVCLAAGRKLADGTAAQVRGDPAVIEACLGGDGGDGSPAG